MVSHKLSQRYKQYHCSIFSVFVVLSKTIIISGSKDPFTIKLIIHIYEKKLTKQGSFCNRNNYLTVYTCGSDAKKTFSF